MALLSQAAAAVACLVGCLGADARQCADERLCRGDLLCDEAHGACVPPEAFAICEGRDDGAPCSVDGAAGVCDRAVCVTVGICGNGQIEEGEECDCGVGDAVSSGCAFPNSDIPGAECQAGCTAHCGDDIVNVAEDCEGTLVHDTDCLDANFDFGPLSCEACALSTELCGRLGWEGRSLAVNKAIYDLWGTGDTLWAVGDGLVARQTAGEWELLDAPTALGTWPRLRGVWGSGPGDVYAVGDTTNDTEVPFRGIVLHYDGSGWAEVVMPESIDMAPLRLHDVHGSSGSNILVVGEDGLVLHYDGTWTEEDVDCGVPCADLYGVSLAATGEGIAVGNRSLIHHRTPEGDWSNQPGPVSTALNAVWSRSANDAFAVGTNGTIWHFGGETEGWTAMASNTEASLVAVIGDADEVYAVGGSATVVRYDGSEWISMGGGTTRSLQGVWVGDRITAAGQQTWVQSYRGSTWSPRPPPVPFAAIDISVSPTGELFVSNYAGIWRYDGSQFTPFSPVLDGTISVWIEATAADTVYVVTAGSPWCLRRADESTSEILECLEQGLTMGDLDGSEGWIAAVVSDGSILEGTGDNWLLSPGPPAGALRNVWATADDLMVATESGGLWRRDSLAQWSDLRPECSEGAPPCPVLRDIWGVTADDVYAVGEGGTVLHFDGVGLTQVPVPTAESLRAIDGRSATDIYVVGELGGVLHYDGVGFSRVRSPLLAGLHLAIRGDQVVFWEGNSVGQLIGVLGQ